MKGLEQFRLSHDLPEHFPVPVSDMVVFIAFLSAQGYAPTTAATYVAAIGFYHKIHGWSNPAEKFIVKQMLHGFARKVGKERDPRFPITMVVLENIIRALQKVCSNVYERKMYHAAFTIAFFGFMRVGEVTAEAKSRVQPATLKGADVIFIRVGGAECLQVSFRCSKNNQCGPPQVIVIHRQSNPALCPVLAMRQFLQDRPAAGKALFCHFDGMPLTRSQFSSMLERTVAFAGLARTLFRSHSFRIGAASTAAMQGVPDWKIMEMGRWRSAAYKSYIRFPSTN